jgi:hypothetical protein
MSKRLKPNDIDRYLKGLELPEGISEPELLSEQFSLIRSTQQIAMAAVLAPDVAAVYRRIARWYSRNFNTPLHEVEELPICEVLLHYFEERFSMMKSEDVEDLRKVLARTESEEAEAKKEEEHQAISDDEFVHRVEELERKKRESSGVSLEDVLKNLAAADQPGKTFFEKAEEEQKRKTSEDDSFDITF